MEITSSNLVDSCKSTAICNSGNEAEEIAAVSEEDEREMKRIRSIASSREFPEDVTIEILLRLPIKSLLRFKSVCKPWYGLIRSPNFITLHDKSSLKKKVSIFLHSYNYSSPSTLTFRFFDVFVDLKIPVSVQIVKPLGCCNGLVCLSLWSIHHKFVLWNPATRESRLIYLGRPSRYAERTYAGFCFDPIVNAYKIVRLSFFDEDNFFMVEAPKEMVYVILNVFTVNDNSSRQEELFAPCQVPEGAITYVGRCMYWTVDGHGAPDKYILCFDMVDEMFKAIEFPCGGDIHNDTEIVDYKGRLAVFVREDCTNFFEMWVLNDSGETNQSWRKELSLRVPLSNVAWPLGFFSKDSVHLVVLSVRDQCLLWDRDSGEITKLYSGYRCYHQFLPYSESFASVY